MTIDDSAIIRQVSIGGDLKVQNTDIPPGTTAQGYVIDFCTIGGNLFVQNNSLRRDIPSDFFFVSYYIADNQVDGRIHVQGNIIEHDVDVQTDILVARNTAGGKIFVTGNDAGGTDAIPGLFRVWDNVSSKTITIRDNAPDPDVSGNLENQ